MSDQYFSMKDFPAIYLILTLILLSGAYYVFKKMVLQDYIQRGKLTKLSSSLQLAVFAGLMSFPYLFNPPEWPWVWRLAGPTSMAQQILGFLLILLGLLVAFGTMAWFGIQRAFGMQVNGLVCQGPYRFSRNPKILGGYLLVIGTTIQWPSWYGATWIALYGIIGHWMIVTEEEHLRSIFGAAYTKYCAQTPRYLINLPKSHHSATRDRRV